MSVKKVGLVAMAVLLIGFFTSGGQASMARNCIFKAKIVDLQKVKAKTKKIHPDVTFGGTCYSDFYYAQIEAIDINNSFYLGNSKEELPYCEGLLQILSDASKESSNRPIGIKLCVGPNVEPPKVGDVVDIRYSWLLGRTDTKPTVIWTYLSRYVDRETRKKNMSKQCDEGDASICVQLGQMYWQDKDVDREIESYRKGCEINKQTCTYYVNALKRTGRTKELKAQ